MNAKRAWTVATVALMLSSAVAAQQGRKMPERYTAVASNISAIAPAGLTPLDITINRYTTDAEEERLMAALDEKGQDGLIDALQDIKPIGHMRTPGSLAYNFHYARQGMRKDGLRRIVLVTDRPMSFGELTARTITVDYPFTMLELLVDDSGHGEGKLFLATKFIRTGDLLVLENLVSQPIVLSNVRPEK